MIHLGGACGEILADDELRVLEARLAELGGVLVGGAL